MIRVVLDTSVLVAAAEKLSALMTVEHLRPRARRAKREDFDNLRLTS